MTAIELKEAVEIALKRRLAGLDTVNLNRPNNHVAMPKQKGSPFGRPSKTGLSIKELGSAEYNRRYRAISQTNSQRKKS